MDYIEVEDDSEERFSEVDEDVGEEEEEDGNQIASEDSQSVDEVEETQLGEVLIRATTDKKLDLMKKTMEGVYYFSIFQHLPLNR